MVRHPAKVLEVILCRQRRNVLAALKISQVKSMLREELNVYGLFHHYQAHARTVLVNLYQQMLIESHSNLPSQGRGQERRGGGDTQCLTTEGRGCWLEKQLTRSNERWKEKSYPGTIEVKLSF